MVLLMSKPAIFITAAALVMSSGIAPASAQYWRSYGPAYSSTVWHYDGRDDDRDFPTNGFFPGNFAANPPAAAIGAAGLFGGTPARGRYYGPRVGVGSQQYQAYCARRYHSYDPASGSFVGKDNMRHRC
jgi:hypothetical protein